jgi:hypothetical protein
MQNRKLTKIDQAQNINCHNSFLPEQGNVQPINLKNKIVVVMQAIERIIKSPSCAHMSSL